MFESVIEKIASFGVIPVIRIDRAADATPLAEALKAGGLPCAEVTFRTDAAEDAIRAIAASHPEFLIIAGTVLTPDQADRAIAAGASAIVAPGFNPAVVRHCIDHGYPVVPGVATPTEVEAAMSLGLNHLKFFPAEAAGGVKMIRAMSAPYTKVKFMPTGGIGENNLRDYLSCKAVFACGGSFMVPPEAITGGDFDTIRDLTAKAVNIVREVRTV